MDERRPPAPPPPPPPVSVVQEGGLWPFVGFVVLAVGAVVGTIWGILSG